MSDMHRREQPYRATRGRWGDSLPKVTPMDSGERDALGNPIVEWWSKSDIIEAGMNPADHTFYPADLGWAGITHPTPKITATDPRKNRTPRRGDEELYTRASVSTFEAEKVYGTGIWAKIGEPTDDLPFNLDMLDLALGEYIGAVAMRLSPRRK